MYFVVHGGIHLIFICEYFARALLSLVYYFSRNSVLAYVSKIVYWRTVDNRMTSNPYCAILGYSFYLLPVCAERRFSIPKIRKLLNGVFAFWHWWFPSCFLLEADYFFESSFLAHDIWIDVINARLARGFINKLR